MSKEMIEAMTSGGTSVHEIRCGRSLNLTLDNVYDSQRLHLLSLVQELKYQRLATIFESLVLSSLVFRSSVQSTIHRSLFACTQHVEERIVLSGDGSKGQILRARITRRRCLISISFLGEKIVLRVRFGSITA